MLVGTPRSLNDLLAIFGVGVGSPTNEAIRDLLSSLKQAAKFTTAALAAAATAAAGDLTGAAYVVFTNTAINPGTYTTRTAAQMLADGLLSVGDTYELRIINGQGTGVLTLGNGVGVTLTGTMTMAINSWRDFIVTVTGANAITIQNAGTGTFS